MRSKREDKIASYPALYFPPFFFFFFFFFSDFERFIKKKRENSSLVYYDWKVYRQTFQAVREGNKVIETKRVLPLF